MHLVIWSAAVSIGFLVATSATAETTPAAAAEPDSSQLVRLGPMSVARAAHQATVLASGEVLVTGGCSGECDSSLRSAERYSPQTRTFRPAAAMAIERGSHAAVALDDGRVLVAGGWSNDQVARSAELYDPDTDRFTIVGDMIEARGATVVARLPDGRVLFSGGQTSEFEPLASAEIFDPATSTFSPAGSMTVPRMNHRAVALPDGRVLIVGGRQARRGGILRSAELFDPAGGRFETTGEMSSPRHKHAAMRLPDGRVLVIGGSDARDQRGRYRSTEIYDPATGRFSAGPDMRSPRFKFADAVVPLASGAILVAGGATRPEIYDADAGIFVAIPAELDQGREFATASALPDGTVLLLGGYDERIRTSSSAWLLRALD